MNVLIVAIISGTIISLTQIIVGSGHSNKRKSIDSAKVEQLSIKMQDMENQLKASNARIIELEKKQEKLKA